MIRTVIFDYGDTLVRHSVPFEILRPKAIYAIYSYFVSMGLESTFDRYNAINSSVFEAFAEIEARENRDIPDAVKYEDLVGRLFPSRSMAWRHRMARTAVRKFYEVGARYRKVARGAKPCLDELKSMGLKMAVLSNHSDQQALEHSLAQFRLESYFLRVFSSSELGVRKPDSRIFAKCLAALRTRADQTILVGDSLKNDAEGAAACGMKTILVEWEKSEHLQCSDAPDFKVDTLAAIPKIVRKLNSA